MFSIFSAFPSLLPQKIDINKQRKKIASVKAKIKTTET